MTVLSWTPNSYVVFRDVKTSPSPDDRIASAIAGTDCAKRRAAPSVLRDLLVSVLLMVAVEDAHFWVVIRGPETNFSALRKSFAILVGLPFFAF